MSTSSPVLPVIVGASRQSPAGTPVNEALSGLGNTGNIAFSHAVEHCLFPPRTVSVELAVSSRPARHGGVAVMPCANFLRGVETGGNLQRMRLLKRFGLPVIALGLGAQAELDSDRLDLAPDSLRLLRRFAEQSPNPRVPNIGVRGEFTRRVIEAAGLGQHVRVLGCPSLYLSPEPFLGRVLAARWAQGVRRVAVGGWAEHIPPTVERGLARLADATDGEYIIQHPADLVRLAAGHPELVERKPMVDKARRLWAPEGGSLESWAAQRLRAYYNVPDWQAAMQRYDAYLGCRIHGTMLSLQAGIPAVCITHDSRTREMCETMGVPQVPVADVEREGVSLDNLRRWFERAFDPAAFDARRLDLARQTLELLRRSGVKVQGGQLARMLAAAGAPEGSAAAA